MPDSKLPADVVRHREQVLARRVGVPLHRLAGARLLEGAGVRLHAGGGRRPPAVLPRVLRRHAPARAAGGAVAAAVAAVAATAAAAAALDAAAAARAAAALARAAVAVAAAAAVGLCHLFVGRRLRGSGAGSITTLADCSAAAARSASPTTAEDDGQDEVWPRPSLLLLRGRSSPVQFGGHQHRRLQR